MARGSGFGFGQALVACLADAAGGTVGVLRSYTAKGWHAQLTKLTSSPRGYIAAEKAGLSATADTLKKWLGNDEYPIQRSNQEKIEKAYRMMAGRWPREVENKRFTISGVIKIGNDERNRGGGKFEPLIIEGSEGNWNRLRDAWESGEVDADDFEEWFAEDVIEEDIGEGSEDMEFPGGSYTVTC